MNYYSNIKQELINNEINRRVKNYFLNRSDLKTYYNVGKMLNEAGKHYGEGIIKEYSKRLTNELGKKYSTRLLYRILRYYKFLETQKMPTVSANLSWSHYDEILSIDNFDEINYYINLVKTQNLSVRKLREKIKLNEYERLPESTKNKLAKKEELEIVDSIPEPIIIHNNDKEQISEKTLQMSILEDIPSFLEELGNGYTFVKNEYPIKVGSTYNYIDILLFNYIYNSFVVVELKIGELKKEHIGQIQVYINYIDNNIKAINHNKTIGIIICKEYNKYIIKYSSNEQIIARTYELV